MDGVRLETYSCVHSVNRVKDHEFLKVVDFRGTGTNKKSVLKIFGNNGLQVTLVPVPFEFYLLYF